MGLRDLGRDVVHKGKPVSTSITIGTANDTERDGFVWCRASLAMSVDSCVERSETVGSSTCVPSPKGNESLSDTLANAVIWENSTGSVETLCTRKTTREPLLPLIHDNTVGDNKTSCGWSKVTTPALVDVVGYPTSAGI